MTTSVATCRPPAAAPQWNGAAAMQRSRQAALAQAPEPAKQAPAADESLQQRTSSKASHHQNCHKTCEATKPQSTMAQCRRDEAGLLSAAERPTMHFTAHTVWAIGSRPDKAGDEPHNRSGQRVVGGKRTRHTLGLRQGCTNGIYLALYDEQSSRTPIIMYTSWQCQTLKHYELFLSDWH